MSELYDIKNHYSIIKHWQEYICKQKICWNDRRNKSTKCHVAMWEKGIQVMAAWVVSVVYKRNTQLSMSCTW